MPAEFPEALRWAMSRAGMGVNKLAREVGLSKSTIRNWLKGHDRPTSKERIERIEEALGLSPGALTSRVRRWEVKDTGVYKEGATGRLAEIGSTSCAWPPRPGTESLWPTFPPRNARP